MKQTDIYDRIYFTMIADPSRRKDSLYYETIHRKVGYNIKRPIRPRGYWSIMARQIIKDLHEGLTTCIPGMNIDRAWITFAHQFHKNAGERIKEGIPYSYMNYSSYRNKKRTIEAIMIAAGYWPYPKWYKVTLKLKGSIK